MTSVKMILVKDEGVLGYIVNENEFGANARWYVDGFRYESFLEKEDYVINFIGEIDG